MPTGYPLSGAVLAPGPGRPKGSVSPSTRMQRQLALDIIGKPGSEDYKEFVLACRKQLIKGTLAPAIAVLIIQYGFGKPVERIEIKDTTESLDSLSVEELRERALKVAQEILSPPPLAIEGEVLNRETDVKGEW